MDMQTIKKTIEVKAPKEKVWDVLLQDEYTRKWYAEFSEGTHAETNWEIGSKAIFTDDSKSGLVSKVIAHKPNEIISMEYAGIVTEGNEDYESDAAKAIKGGHETYELSDSDGITKLSIKCDMAADYFEMMSAAWDKALQKIKGLSEAV